MDTRLSCCHAKLTDVSVTYGETLVLDRINMALYGHEITGIIGTNGAGKTTLFRTLLGEVPYTGTIEWMLDEIHYKDKLVRPTIGYVPQQLQFDKGTPLTVVELFAACLRRRPIWLPISKSFKEQVYSILEEVGLAYVLERQIGVLSGGELQRVLLALAIMPTPSVLLLDEPISGVDVKGQEVFYQTVEALKHKYHMAIVLITHEIDKIEGICDRAILLDKGVLYTDKPSVVKEMAKEAIGWK